MYFYVFKRRFLIRYNSFYNKMFTGTWPLNRERNPNLGVDLRNRELLDIPFARTSLTARLPLNSFPKIWLDFTEMNIKNIRKCSEFDDKLKKFFIEDLADQIICYRIPILLKDGEP